MPGGSYTLLPGGKGANQALAAHRAGAAVMLAGAVGRDGFAAVALSSLRSEGVDRRLVRDLDLPTGCAVSMVLAAAENTIAVAPGAKMGVQCDRVPDELLDANTILLAQFEVPPSETAETFSLVASQLDRQTRRDGAAMVKLIDATPILLGSSAIGPNRTGVSAA